MTRLQWMKCGIVACFLAATSALAQSTAVRTATDAPSLVSRTPASSHLLRALDSSLQTVVSKVSPAVVHPVDQVLKIDVLRGANPMSFYVLVKVHHENIHDLADSWAAEELGPETQPFLLLT